MFKVAHASPGFIRAKLSRRREAFWDGEDRVGFDIVLDPHLSSG
jgi:hypothetical protein